MPAMQRAHRRHQPDPLLPRPPSGNRLAQSRHRSRHGDIARRHLSPVQHAVDHRLGGAEIVGRVGQCLECLRPERAGDGRISSSTS